MLIIDGKHLSQAQLSVREPHACSEGAGTPHAMLHSASAACLLHGDTWLWIVRCSCAKTLLLFTHESTQLYILVPSLVRLLGWHHHTLNLTAAIHTVHQDVVRRWHACLTLQAFFVLIMIAVSDCHSGMHRQNKNDAISAQPFSWMTPPSHCNLAGQMQTALLHEGTASNSELVALSTIKQAVAYACPLSAQPWKRVRLDAV